MQEGLKVAGKLIDATTSLGRYLATVAGDAPRDIVAWAIGDRVVRARIRNFLNLQDEVEARAKRIPDDRRTPASEALGLPLLEAATEEDRPELRDMWADLLASTMIDQGQTYRRVFRDIVGRMEPIDAVIFREAARMENAMMLYEANPIGPAPMQQNAERSQHLDQHARQFGYQDDAIRYSFQELQEGLGLLAAQSFPGLTPLGRALTAALEAIPSHSSLASPDA